MEDCAVKKVFSRMGLGLLAFVGLQQIVVAVAAALVQQFAPQITERGWYLWILSYVPLYLIGFPALLLIMNTVPSHSRRPDTAFPRMSAGQIAKTVLVCIGIVYPLNLLSTLLSSLVAQLKQSEVVNPLAEMALNSNPFINVFFVALVAPVMEEIIFRDIILKKLTPFGGKVYVFFSALLFTLIHMNVYQLLYAYVLGVLFGAIAWFTGRLRYTVILHIIINFIGSGVGPILLYCANETVLGVWGVTVMALMCAGIVLGVIWLVRDRKNVRFAPPDVALPRKSLMFANPGMILMILFSVSMTAIALLA